MSAICITLGEQSENHHGMIKQGNGLAKNGFSIDKLNNIKKKFEILGGKTEFINCLDYLEETKDVDEAGILILRDCLDILFNDSSFTTNEIFNELKQLNWDKKYYDVRRKKWLNKHARYNLCFGNEFKELNEQALNGTIIPYNKCPLMSRWKNEIQNLCGEGVLEAEGNYYYNLEKTGIGFHGDCERKKVIALNLSDPQSIREINWQWFERSMPIGKRIKVILKSGDCYLMSEKASGYDWKKKIKYVTHHNKKIKINNKTLRHAAGIPNSKYLQIKKKNHPRK